MKDDNFSVIHTNNNIDKEKDSNISSQLDDANNELNAKIEDGSIFKEALNWYYTKYLYPISQRSFWLFIGLTLLIVMTIEAFIIYRLYPLNSTENLYLHNKDMVKYHLKLADISDYKLSNHDSQKLPLEELFLKKLILHYIRIREEFKEGKLDIAVYEKKRIKIKNLSTNQVYKQFVELSKLTNIHNSFKDIMKNGHRVINILSFDFIHPTYNFFDKIDHFVNENKIIPSKAIVNLETALSNVERQNIVKKRFRLYIEFVFKDKNALLKQNKKFDLHKLDLNNSFDFKVIKYYIKEISEVKD